MFGVKVGLLRLVSMERAEPTARVIEHGLAIWPLIMWLKEVVQMAVVHRQWLFV